MKTDDLMSAFVDDRRFFADQITVEALAVLAKFTSKGDVGRLALRVSILVTEDAATER